MTNKYIDLIMNWSEQELLTSCHIFLVHGFNVRDRGHGTVDQLQPLLRRTGAEVDKDSMDYGYFGLLDIRLRNGERRRRVLYRMANSIEEALATNRNVVLIGHSNGCHFINTVLRMLPMEVFEKVIVIYISAAMERKTEPSLATKRELNLITPHDGWVRLASYLRFNMPWGRRGAKGYSGKSHKVVNWRRSEVKGHSAWFSTEHVFMTAYFCMKFIKEHIR